MWSYLSSIGTRNDSSSQSSQQEQDNRPIRNEREHVKTKSLPDARQENVDALQQLVDTKQTPIGSFQASTWRQAERSLRWIVDQEDLTKAFQLLDRMVQEPDSHASLRVDLLYLVVHTWLDALKAKKQSEVSANSYNQYKSRNNHSYASTNAATGGTPSTVLPPMAVWRKLEAYQHKGIQLDDRIYNRVIEGTALVTSKKQEQGPFLAETILQQMLKLSKHNPLLRPSTFTFNAVLASWEAASTFAEAPHRAHALLKQLTGFYEAGWGQEVLPDRTTYRRVMTLYAHKGNGAQVEALLEDLYDLYNEHGQAIQLQPKTPFFTLVLYAWSKSTEPQAAQRATVILERMLELEASGELPGLKVDASCFNIVMVCWSKLRTEESDEQVQALFEKLKELSQTDPKKRPNGGSWAALITTQSRVDAQLAEDLFWQWKREHDQHQCDMRADSRMFHGLISGWYHSKHPQAAERCEALLHHVFDGDLTMWEPTVVVFSMAINAWARNKTLHDMERSEALLRQIEDYIEKSPSSELEARPSMFVPLVHGWAHIGQAERADRILREWFDKYDKETLTEKERLDTRAFNQVLKTWSNMATSIPDAADRAEDLLLRMRDYRVRPNGKSFQLVSECRRRSRGKGHTTSMSPRAAELIDFLDQVYQTGGWRNSDVSYLSLRHGWTEGYN
jgi:hypothetical protein